MTKQGTTREQIVDAALRTLADDGFAGATSRAIARRGGFNQALVFYYFGSLDALLLAALDKTSEARLERYRAAVRAATTLEELVAVAARAYRDDRKSRHVAVVAQMVAGSVTRPELAPAVLARMEPWVELAREALEQAARLAHVPELVPLDELAYAVTAFYLGLNLSTHLEGDRARADALFARLESVAPALGTILENSARERT
jgi:AcrR family transcriptional regulator